MSDYQRWKEERRNLAIEWARGILANPDAYVIFDTETTGLKDSDVIIHLGVMDMRRNMLIDTLVKPTSKRRIAEEAKYIHGLTLKDLKDAPLFESVVKDLVPIVSGKKILSFNAEFHERLLQQTYENEGVADELPLLEFEDVKTYFEDFMKRDRLSLPGRKNTGVGDCNATLDVIVRIADGEIVNIPDKPETAINSSNSTGKSSWNTLLFILFVILGGVFIKDHWFLGSALAGIGIYLLYKKD